MSVHIGQLMGMELNAVLIIFLFLTFSLFGVHCFLLKNVKPMLPCMGFNNNAIPFKGVKGKRSLFLFFLMVLPAIMYCSWIAFLIFSILCLFFTLFLDDIPVPGGTQFLSSSWKTNAIVVLFSALILLILSYLVSRSDLDDAFYVALAAFAASHPSQILKNMGDPMLGEAGLPLIFPSYRFSSFELLSGAGGYLFSVPAMDFYYIYLMPIWILASILAIFLLTREVAQEYGVLSGFFAITLILLLGEMHRAPANFSFVRLFQGKAVFLSFIIPAIFYITARYLSNRGQKSDLMLLGCCQIASIGFTNCGMLFGPIAGFIALLSNGFLVWRNRLFKEFLYAFGVIFIPLPYLIDVALESKDSPIMNFGIESAESVWLSVFGPHQQYLVGILILAGPILAKDAVARWRLAVPPLFLYAVFLNPALSKFISKYITTPPVYWRVIWSFPILVFAGVSLCLIICEVRESKSHFMIRALLAVLVFFIILYSLPFHTLRKENVGDFDKFAAWKIPSRDLTVSKTTMRCAGNNGRVLAPDEIAGVISRFEVHPRLISTRGLYLHLMRPFFSSGEYEARSVLYRFVTQKDTEDDGAVVQSALHALEVSVVVLNMNSGNKAHFAILMDANYKPYFIKDGYSIWVGKVY